MTSLKILAKISWKLIAKLQKIKQEVFHLAHSWEKIKTSIYECTIIEDIKKEEFGKKEELDDVLKLLDTPCDNEDNVKEKFCKSCINDSICYFKLV